MLETKTASDPIFSWENDHANDFTILRSVKTDLMKNMISRMNGVKKSAMYKGALRFVPILRGNHEIFGLCQAECF